MKLNRRTLMPQPRHDPLQPGDFGGMGAKAILSSPTGMSMAGPPLDQIVPSALVPQPAGGGLLPPQPMPLAPPPLPRISGVKGRGDHIIKKAVKLGLVGVKPEKPLTEGDL